MGAGYRIQYCLLTQQGVSTTCPSSIVRGKNRTRVTVENLERDQHYEIRVLPFNGQGDGPSTKSKVVYVGEGKNVNFWFIRLFTKYIFFCLNYSCANWRAT